MRYLTDFFLSGMLTGMFFILLGVSCANDGKREAWQDCAGISHEVCRMGSSSYERDCEYEYYKKGINE